MSHTAAGQATSTGFGARLSQQFAAGNHLCVGIDPHKQLLATWAVDDTPAGLERFGREVVAAAAETAGVACIKPQVAFFERLGSGGFMALERVLADARDAGLLIVADCKRGDIGSSFAGYAEAWLATGSPLEADAMTAAAYQGVGSLCEIEPYLQAGKGLFILAATSNPEARSTQLATRADGRSVARAVVDEAAAWNSRLAATSVDQQPDAGTVGQVGVVLGATLQLGEFGIDAGAAGERVLPVLAPGFGSQGAKLAEAGRLFGGLGPGVLANVSRSVLGGGVGELRQRIASAVAELAQASL